MSRACEYGQVEVVRYMLDNGTSLEAFLKCMCVRGQIILRDAEDEDDDILKLDVENPAPPRRNQLSPAARNPKVSKTPRPQQKKTQGKYKQKEKQKSKILKNRLNN